MEFTRERSAVQDVALDATFQPRTSRAPVARGRWLALATLPLLLGGLGGVFWLRPVGVEIVPVTQGRALEAVYATGTVAPDVRLRVKARAPGHISSLLVREGDHVERDQLLAVIASPTLSSALEAQQVSVQAANEQASLHGPQLVALQNHSASLAAELKQATAELVDLERLFTAGSTSRIELDRARARVTSLKANLAASLAEQRALTVESRATALRSVAELKSISAQAADTNVRAPIAGIVLRRSIEVSETINVNDVLFTLGDDGPLAIDASVDEADVAKISDGGDGRTQTAAAISLYGFSGQVFRGRVTRIFPEADPERKSFRAKIQFADRLPPGLRSGMTAEVNLIVEEHPSAVLVPTSAIVNGTAWLAEDGIARRKLVQTGIRDLLHTEVTAGLAPGQRVLLNPPTSLRDGDRVRELAASTIASPSAENGHAAH